MNVPKTKTELRRVVGLFSYFREHYFAGITKPLTDLTSKRVPAKIPWGPTQQTAFDELKRLLCKATIEPLYVIDFAKPFNLFVDASSYSTSAVLTQTSDDGNGIELPVAFSSTKLTPTQCKWSTIEREAYTALVALQKYRNWIFGAKITLYSDHNTLLYLTELQSLPS